MKRRSTVTVGDWLIDDINNKRSDSTFQGLSNLPRDKGYCRGRGSCRSSCILITSYLQSYLLVYLFLYLLTYLLSQRRSTLASFYSRGTLRPRAWTRNLRATETGRELKSGGSCDGSDGRGRREYGSRREVNKGLGDVGVTAEEWGVLPERKEEPGRMYVRWVVSLFPPLWSRCSLSGADVDLRW